MPDSWGERKSARTPRLFVNFPTRIGGLFGSFMSVSEDIVEQVANEWFQELGYVYPAGSSIAHGEPGCETRLLQRGRTPELALVCHRSLQPEGSRSRPGRCSPEGTADRGTDSHPGQLSVGAQNRPVIGALASDNVPAYGDATITIEDTFTSVQAQRFVFTVTQRGPVYDPRVFAIDSFSAPVLVPEPTTLAMATAGLAVAAIAKLRQRCGRTRRG